MSVIGEEPFGELEKYGKYTEWACLSYKTISFAARKELFGNAKEALWACERVRLRMRKGSFGIARKARRKCKNNYITDNQEINKNAQNSFISSRGIKILKRRHSREIGVYIYA